MAKTSGGVRGGGRETFYDLGLNRYSTIASLRRTGGQYVSGQIAQGQRGFVGIVKGERTRMGSTPTIMSQVFRRKREAQEWMRGYGFVP